MLKFPIAHTNDWLHTCDPLYYKSRHIWNLGINLNWNDTGSPSFIGHATSLNDRRELMKSHGISSVKNREWRTVISWWKTFQFLPLLLNDRYCVQKSRGHHSVLLQWRHNEHDSVSNHQPHDCLLNRLFRHRSKKISNLCVTDFCEGNLPVTGKFPAQRAKTRKMFSYDDVVMYLHSNRVCLVAVVWLYIYSDPVTAVNSYYFWAAQKAKILVE